MCQSENVSWMMPAQEQLQADYTNLGRAVNKYTRPPLTKPNRCLSTTHGDSQSNGTQVCKR